MMGAGGGGGSGGIVPGSPLPADRLARKQRNFPRRGGFCHSALLKSAVMAYMSEGGNNNNNNGPSTPNAIHRGGLIPTSSNSSPRKRMRRTDGATVSSAHPTGGAATTTAVTGSTNLTSAASSLARSSSLSSSSAGGGGDVGCGGGGGPVIALVDDDAVIARATDLLQRLCVKPLDHSDSPKSRHNMRRNPSSGGMLGSSRSGASLTPDTLSSCSNNNNSRDGGDFERKAPIRRVSRRTSYASQISTGTDYDDLDDDEFH